MLAPPDSVFSNLLEKKTLFPSKFGLVLYPTSFELAGRYQPTFTRNYTKKMFTRKSFVRVFPTSKLEIKFHSRKKAVPPKLENFGHLFTVNFKRAKFQKN